MTMTVSGITENSALFDAIERFLRSPDPMKETLIEIKKAVLELTEAGKDYRGRKFAPYTPEYAKRKGSKFVNLRDTGKMLRSMTAEVISPTRGKVEIKARKVYSGRADTKMIAQIHTTGTGKMPQRDFMDVTDNRKNKIIKKTYDDPLFEIARRFR
jgi:hypothetical protein